LLKREMIRGKTGAGGREERLEYLAVVDGSNDVVSGGRGAKSETMQRPGIVAERLTAS
jgi:hypothetical protein